MQVSKFNECLLKSDLFSGETESGGNSSQPELDAEGVLVVLARLLHAGIGRFVVVLLLNLEVVVLAGE